MADFTTPLASVGGLFAVAVRSFVGTVLLMLGVGAGLAGVTYLILAQHHPVYGAIGALLAFLEALVVGFVWGSKRAVILALAHALEQQGLGQAVVRMLFARLIPGGEDREIGERGGIVTRTVERIPLAQAEGRLRLVVNEIVRDTSGQTGVTNVARSWLRTRLYRWVETVTLARFRETDAKQGGIDLRMLQHELEPRLDEWLVAKLTASLRWWTVLVLLGLPAQVMATVYVVLALLK